MKIGDKYKKRYPSKENDNPVAVLKEIFLEEEYVVLSGRHASKLHGKRIYIDGDYETTLMNLICSYIKVNTK